MCRESFFTSLGLLQCFLSLYTWEKKHFPFSIDHQDLPQCWASGCLALAGRRHCGGRTSGSAPLHPEQSPDCNLRGTAGGFLSLPCYGKQFPMTMGAQHMPSTNRWVGKGQNLTCEKGRRWDGLTLTELQGLRETRHEGAGVLHLLECGAGETIRAGAGEKKGPGLKKTTQLPQGTGARWERGWVME